MDLIAYPMSDQKRAASGLFDRPSDVGSKSAFCGWGQGTQTQDVTKDRAPRRKMRQRTGHTGAKCDRGHGSQSHLAIEGQGSKVQDATEDTAPRRISWMRTWLPGASRDQRTGHTGAKCDRGQGSQSHLAIEGQGSKAQDATEDTAPRRISWMRTWLPGASRD